jgi:hypothetical protein
VKALPEEPPRPGEQEYLDELLVRPLAGVDPRVLAGLEASPFDPSEAVNRAAVERL